MHGAVGTLLLAFLLQATPVAAAEACASRLSGLKLHAQSGPGCLPAAAAMGLSVLGKSIEPADLTRSIPFYRDGANLMDVQNALAELGIESLIFTGGQNDAAQLVEAGFPIVLFLESPAGKHAVLVWGAYRQSANGRCTDEPSALGIADPAEGTRKVLKRDELEPLWGAGQMMVLFMRLDKARRKLSGKGFPIEKAEAANHRFRAEEWVLRARKHGEPCRQKLELLNRARAEDPCWEEPYHELIGAHVGMGEEKQATFYDEQLARLREGHCPPGNGQTRSKK